MSSAAAREPNALIWAARLAVAGPVLCLTLVAVLHVLEPEVNDSDAVSEYALGDYGWLMNIAFFSGAAGIGALAFALHRSLARSKSAIAGIILLSIAAVAWVLLGAGNIDPRRSRRDDARTDPRDRLLPRAADEARSAARPRGRVSPRRALGEPPAAYPGAGHRSSGRRGRRLLGSCVRGDASALARPLARLDRTHRGTRSQLAPPDLATRGATCGSRSASWRGQRRSRP